ncbi:reverse transcriptase domain-containing protein [Tanacetum coccineum]
MDFGLRHHMIQQVQNSQFHGLPGDDANRHIDIFLEITQHMKQNGVSDDALVVLFPYSLTHHAIARYDLLLRNSIHSFDDMMRKFLSKYFPPSMVTKLRNEIMKFEQKPHESLFEAWERYKLSIDRCPNHNMLLVTQIDTFYNGLTLSHRDTINAAAGGTFMQKTPEECYELIENMTAHHNHWDTSATRDETSRNISSTTTTESPEVVRQLEMMNKNFVEMMRQIQTVKTVDTKCETCGGPHSFTECPAVGGYTQEAAYATTGNYNSGGNSYQPQGDRNLLSYRSNNYLGPPGFNQPNVQNNQNRYNQNQNQNQGNYQASNNQGRGQNFNKGNNNYQAPNLQAPNNQAQVGPSNELTSYMKSNEAILRDMRTQMTNMKMELRKKFKSSLDARTNKIENQNNQMMTQNNELKNMMTNFFQMQHQNQNQSTSSSGLLPSNTVANPRGELKAITTQSGVSYDGPSVPIPPPFINPDENEREEETSTDPVYGDFTIKVPPPLVQKSQKSQNQKSHEMPQRDPQHPNIPYPSRMTKEKQQEKDKIQNHKFWKMIKQLHINITLVDALILIPKYQKMLKELLSNILLVELANTPLSENCSAVILKKLLEKLGDPGKFLIPCSFSELKCQALADLGASINLMSLSVWKRLGLPELIPTRMTLELANLMVCAPAGIASDVFVPVGKFTFPADFVIVDYIVDARIPLILGRPFLRTAHALIDVYGEELILRDAYLANDSFLPRSDDADFDLEGDLRLIEELLNNDPSSPLPLSHNPLSSSTTSSSPSLTPVETSDVLLEEFVDELALLEPFLLGIGDDDFDQEGDILLLEKLINDDPSSPLPPKELNFEKLKMIKSSIDDFPLLTEVKPLFNEELEYTESNESCFSNLDDPDLSVTPLSDTNKDECFDPGGDIDEINAFLDMDISMDIKDGYYDLERDIVYLKSLLINDTIPNFPPEVFLDHDLRSLKDELDANDLKSMDKIFDPGISAYSFYSLEPVAYECPMEVCSSTCFVPNITII